MSFKNGSSRFNPGPRNNSGSRPSGSSNSGNGGYQNRGNQERHSNGGGKEFPFSRIASISVAKSAEDAAKDFAHDELKNSGLKLTAKVYLGKGDDASLVLKNGDMLLLQFTTNEKDKEFVLGHISVKN